MEKQQEYPRVPITQKEYHAILMVMGLLNMMDGNDQTLKNRLRLTGRGYTDWRMITGKLAKVFDKLLKTVPANKLMQMKVELKNVRAVVTTTPDYTGNNRKVGYFYCPEKAMERMIARIINSECLCCDMSAKQCKRCMIFKDINEIYPWELPPGADGKCPMAGMYINEEELK